MMIQHIALVPETNGVDFSELARVAAALQKQVTRDLAPLWGVSATVDAFPELTDVPVGYRPILLTFCDLGRQGGVHLDDNGQPYAQVQVARDWSLAASQACLEMLINPFGARRVGAQSPRSEQGPVEFLIEVCGPCADARYAYMIDSVVVSDFCTPAFFWGDKLPSGRYSCTSAAKRPLRPLRGGHVSWYDPLSGCLWLRNRWGENPVDALVQVELGLSRAPALSMREILNAYAPLRAHSRRPPPPLFAERAAHARRASEVKAHRLRALLGKRLDQDLDPPPELKPADRGFEQPMAVWPKPVESEADPFDPSELAEIATPEIHVPGQPARVETVRARSGTTPPPLPSTRDTGHVETPAIPSIAPVTTRRGDNTAARGSAAVFVGLGAAAAAALLWLGAREAPDARPDAAAPSMSATAAPAPSMSATAAPAPAAQVPVVAADQPSGPPLCEPAGEVDPAPRAVEVDRAGPPATRLRPERRRAARVQAMPAQPDEPSAAVPEQPRVEDLIGTRH